LQRAWINAHWRKPNDMQKRQFRFENKPILKIFGFGRWTKSSSEIVLKVRQIAKFVLKIGKFGNLPYANLQDRPLKIADKDNNDADTCQRYVNVRQHSRALDDRLNYSLETLVAQDQRDGNGNRDQVERQDRKKLRNF
jgi:hypothetical protein